MNKILFLDLEQTIISSWNDPKLINASVIKNFIKANGFDEVSIFSFAIYHQEDLKTFIGHPDFKNRIESCLDVKININYIPTIEDLKSMLAQECNLHPSKVDRKDFFDFSNKESGFILYCRRNFKNSECTLIDDSIWDEIEFNIPRKNLKLTTINIETLKGKQ